MGKPLFYLNSGRLENRLVEAAGGISVNRELPDGGRPGRTLTVAELNRLNPEVIFTSAFLSNSVEDFHVECLELGVDVEAVRTRRIFAHPSPGWDFGSPRWILGLMFMASVLHPGHCPFDAMAEADIERGWGLPASGGVKSNSDEMDCPLQDSKDRSVNPGPASRWLL